MTQTAGRISVNCGERMRRRREQLGASCTFEGAAKRRLVDLASTAILKACVGIAVKLAFHFAVCKHFLI